MREDMHDGIVDHPLSFADPALNLRHITRRAALEEAAAQPTIAKGIKAAERMNPLYDALRDRLVAFRARWSNLPHVVIPPGPSLAPGAQGLRVAALRRRLGLAPGGGYASGRGPGGARLPVRPRPDRHRARRRRDARRPEQAARDVRADVRAPDPGQHGPRAGDPAGPGQALHPGRRRRPAAVALRERQGCAHHGGGRRQADRPHAGDGGPDPLRRVQPLLERAAGPGARAPGQEGAGPGSRRLQRPAHAGPGRLVLGRQGARPEHGGLVGGRLGRRDPARAPEARCRTT